MKKSRLLFGGKITQKPFQRNFIQFRNPKPDRPLQNLAMDIKYVHIHGTGKNALLLTVIDIYSRKALVHLLKMSIKKGDVLLLLSLMLLEYKAEKMSLRNDNGSQFIAHAVREFLREKNILQEFSRVATPEDNAFIEALHSNLQREVIDRFEFDSVYHAQMVINRYYKWYNQQRRHGSLKGQTPDSVHYQKINPNPFENERTTQLTWRSYPVNRGSIQKQPCYSLIRSIIYYPVYATELRYSKMDTFNESQIFCFSSSF